ncbi:MAG TPA: Ig-like domain-containing protein [Candidatus Limnocylindria bacterium]|nr:Ig-like domain-containing protein [Candidatus Limnocylindria bacterium]
MHSIQKIRAALTAATTALLPLIRGHRAITRLALAALAIAVAVGASLQGASAGPQPAPTFPTSILPENVGVGVQTSDPISLTFPQPMDPASVAPVLAVRPAAEVNLRWSHDGRTLQVVPEDRWRTDARYVVSVDGSARTSSGEELGAARQASFTTQTAPTISDFQLRYVGQSDEQRMRAMELTVAAPEDAADLPPPGDTATGVSAGTSITMGFSAAMNRRDVERRFVISPDVAGDLAWEGNNLIFTPSERLVPDARYAVSVVGARDAQGNRLNGDVSFSFTTQVAAQVVKVSPGKGKKDVTDRAASVWFSRPMDTTATKLTAVDVTNGAKLGGKASWNAEGTQLAFAFADPLKAGHTIRMSLAPGALDEDRNEVTLSWTFAVKAAPAPAPAPAQSATTRSAPPPPPPGGGAPAPADLQLYALQQINASRAQYGFAPLVLDSAISAVASAHAWDMLNYGYFSHTGRDGSRVAQRLSRAGIAYSASGENICYHAGIGARATLDWCHRVFMAEPYPGHFNHIANILSPRFSRVGIGIAVKGGSVKVVWDFAG